jgi:hypothetical protein
MSTGKRQRNSNAQCESDAQTDPKCQKTSEDDFTQMLQNSSAAVYDFLKQGVELFTVQEPDLSEGAQGGGASAVVASVPVDKFLHDYNADLRMYVLKKYITLPQRGVSNALITHFLRDTIQMVKVFLHTMVNNIKNIKDDCDTHVHMNSVLQRVLEEYIKQNYTRKSYKRVPLEKLFETECHDIDEKSFGSVALAQYSLDRYKNHSVNFQEIEKNMEGADFTQYPFTGLYWEFMQYLREHGEEEIQDDAFQSDSNDQDDAEAPDDASQGASDDASQGASEGNTLVDNTVKCIQDNAPVILGVAALATITFVGSAVKSALFGK